MPEEKTGSPFKHLIKNKHKNASIILKFTHKKDEYIIERNFNTERVLKSNLIKNNDVVVSGWNNIDEYIEKMYNIKNVFFNLVIYLSEGHVYRSIHDKEGRYLLADLDEIVGINKIKELGSILNKTYNEYNDIENKLKIRLDGAADDLILKTSSQELEQKINVNITMRDDIKNKITHENYKLFDEKNKLEKFQDIKNILKNAEYIYQEILSIEEEYNTSRSKINDLSYDLNKFILQKELYVSKIQEYEDFIHFLQNTEKNKDYINICPLCKKPLTKKDKKNLIGEYKNEINYYENEIKTMKTNITNIEDDVLNNNKIIKEYENKKIKYEELVKNIPKDENTCDIEKKTNNYNNNIKMFTENINKLEIELSKTETDLIKYRSEKMLLEKMSTFTIQSIRNDLKSISKMQYLLDFIQEGIANFILDQRNSELKTSLYQAISTIWGHFTKSEGWKMRFDEDGTPILVDQDNKEYFYRYLSGGEKTAILVITRTILNKILAENIGFLLIDEPLEHLDSINRRSLLNYLVDINNQNCTYLAGYKLISKV